MAYRSGFEKTVAASLSSRGISFKYESICLPFRKPSRITKKLKELHNLPADYTSETLHTYTPDFILENGVVIEVKGRFTSAMRTIMLNVIKWNPELDIRMCFQRDNKLHGGSKSHYSDWCKQHNILYCVGKIPSEWTLKG